MKVHNDLKELLEAYNEHIMPYTSTEKYRLKERADSFLAYNSLDLGKPEPLAKNKQGENKCECGGNKRIAQ